MSIDWFPFNIKDFLANTKRLNTEAKGAYLCLMLDYYEHLRGAPDDDDVLAAICELSVETWRRHRKVIEPIFTIIDGIWTHERMDSEIQIAQEKIEKSSKRGKEGASARWGSETKQSRKDAKSNAQSMLTASPEQSIKDTDSTLNNILSLSRERAPDLIDQVKVVPPSPPSLPIMDLDDDDEPGLGSQISEEWLPNPEWTMAAVAEGFTTAEIDNEVIKFIAHNQDQAGYSANWQAAWIGRWDRYKQHKAKAEKSGRKGPPRIQTTMNNTPAPSTAAERASYVPTDANWEFGLKMISSGGAWPLSLGQAPGMIGCKCPVELMLKWKIDPATGEKMP